MGLLSWGYRVYQDMIAQMDGHPVDTKARQKLWDEKGVTTKDFSVNDEANRDAWNGTLYLEHGEPKLLQFYEWVADEENIVQHLSEHLGYEVELFEARHSGNGHYSAQVRRKEVANAR